LPRGARAGRQRFCAVLPFAKAGSKVAEATNKRIAGAESASPPPQHRARGRLRVTAPGARPRFLPPTSIAAARSVRTPSLSPVRLSFQRSGASPAPRKAPPGPPGVLAHGWPAQSQGSFSANKSQARFPLEAGRDQDERNRRCCEPGDLVPLGMESVKAECIPHGARPRLTGILRTRSVPDAQALAETRPGHARGKHRFRSLGARRSPRNPVFPGGAAGKRPEARSPTHSEGKSSH
jgi:hypothetical protein